MKYSQTPQAKISIRHLFEGLLRGADFYLLVSGGDSNIASHPKWQDRGKDGQHILIHPGEHEKAVGFIRDWMRDNASEYITIVDPYFGPEELDIIVQIMEIDPSLRVTILTGKRQHQEFSCGLSSAYSSAWRQLCDHSPPEMEILVVGTAGTGSAPFHDRWILSNSAGLRLGTSLNSLGAKDSEISVLGSEEMDQIQRTVCRYRTKKIREVGGERIKYESFEL